MNTLPVVIGIQVFFATTLLASGIYGLCIGHPPGWLQIGPIFMVSVGMGWIFKSVADVACAPREMNVAVSDADHKLDETPPGPPAFQG